MYFFTGLIRLRSCDTDSTWTREMWCVSSSIKRKEKREMWRDKKHGSKSKSL